VFLPEADSGADVRSDGRDHPGAQAGHVPDRQPARPPLPLSALRVRRLGEPDLKAAARSGARGDGGVVGVGDGLDDREAEPDTVSTGLGLRAESFEGLEEAREFPGWDERAGVGDG
jgi:hypothetical protein